MTQFLLRLFVKNADQVSDPKVRAAVGTLSGVVGILCNFSLFLGKVIIGTLSGSVSITADAMNNLSDAASSIVTLVGFKLAEQPADAEHPYGHARFEYLSGLVVSAIIEPWEWEQVQVEMERRKNSRNRHHQTSPFSGKIICADCGDIFGAKTWHSTDRYRRVIWQCNSKFKGERKCETPHLTEERLKDLYLVALGGVSFRPECRHRPAPLCPADAHGHGLH